jgi:hypothetical protein
MSCLRLALPFGRVAVLLGKLRVAPHGTGCLGRHRGDTSAAGLHLTLHPLAEARVERGACGSGDVEPGTPTLCCDPLGGCPTRPCGHAAHPCGCLTPHGCLRAPRRLQPEVGGVEVLGLASEVLSLLETLLEQLLVGLLQLAQLRSLLCEQPLLFGRQTRAGQSRTRQHPCGTQGHVSQHLGVAEAGSDGTGDLLDRREKCATGGRGAPASQPTSRTIHALWDVDNTSSSTRSPRSTTEHRPDRSLRPLEQPGPLRRCASTTDQCPRAPVTPSGSRSQRAETCASGDLPRAGRERGQPSQRIEA